MARRLLVVGWLGIAAMLVVVGLACSEGEPVPDPDDNGQSPPGQEEQVTDLPEEEEAEPDEGYTLEVPIEYVGEHLEPTEIEASVDLLLEASEDATIAALPGRAKGSTGKLFQPSVDSPTQESFWLHVFTDQSPTDAIDWVEHLRSQPPELSRFLSPHLEIFQAAFLGDPAVGDASVSIELLHGHSNGCWRTNLLVFAQDGIVVLLRNAIEVTRESDDATHGATQGSTQAVGSGADLCVGPDELAPLTDIVTIAKAISDRLYSDR